MTASLLYPRATATRRAVSLDGLWKFNHHKNNHPHISAWVVFHPRDFFDIRKKTEKGM